MASNTNLMLSQGEGAVNGGLSFSFPSTAFSGSSDVNGGFNFDMPLASVASFSDQALNFTANNTSNNQAFLQSVIGTSQANVTTTADRAYGVQKDAFNAITSMSNRFGNTIDNSVKKKMELSAIGAFANTMLAFGG